MTITLQSVTLKAQGIQDFVKKFDKPSIDAAIQTAESLHQDGVILVIGEVGGKSLFQDEIPTPVVDVLSNVVPLEKIQHYSSLHHSLSKAYRIFVELTWYRCFQQGSRSVYTSTRDQVINNSTEIKKTLLEKDILTRFEYSCAKQGGKLLTPTEAIWKKHVDNLPDGIMVAEKLSIGRMLKVLKEEGENVSNDLIASWYPDVHYLRWMGVHAQSTQDFEKAIGIEKLNDFQAKGRKYTVCLATIFMEFIKRPSMKFINRSDIESQREKVLDADDNSKKLASKYIDDLLCLRDQSLVKRCADWALKQQPDSENFKNVVRKLDPYWKTRMLIGQHMVEIDQEYTQYIYPTVDLFVQQKHLSIHEGEKKIIETNLSALKAKYQEFGNFIQETEEYLESATGDNRAGEEEEIEKAQKDLQKALEDKESIESEMRILQSLEAVLEELYLQEKQLLEGVLSKKA